LPGIWKCPGSRMTNGGGRDWEAGPVRAAWRNGGKGWEVGPVSGAWRSGESDWEVGLATRNGGKDSGVEPANVEELLWRQRHPSSLIHWSL